ncbi:MAG TPA: glycosyltransferase [Longimicrobiales bacterium]
MSSTTERRVITRTAEPPAEIREDDRAPEVSVLVPVSERPESLVGLYHEFAAPLRAGGWSYEFVFVAEPWFRGLTVPLSELAARGEPVRVLHAGQGSGETQLLNAAIDHCRGEILVTLPPYRRVVASVIPELLARVRGGADIAVARRWPRRDSWVNRLQNRALHALLRRIAGGAVHDVACGVRAARRDVLEEIPLYGDFYRFLPLLALRDGYRVEEVAAPQHTADRHARVYGPGVYLRRLMDVLNLFFLLRFTDKPLRFFGLIGGGLSAAGGAILVLLLIQRLNGHGIADRPLLLLGVLLVVLGFQAIALGLVGEIIVHLHAPARRPYRLARPPAGLGSS